MELCQEKGRGSVVFRKKEVADKLQFRRWDE